MATDTSPASRPNDDLASLEAGLDALDAAAGERRWTLRRLANVVTGVAFTIAIVLGIWQLISVFNDDLRFPSPVEAYRDFFASYAWVDVAHIVFTSVRHAFIGFTLSVIVATPLGLLVWSVGFIRRYFSPILSGLQSLPSVAWVPPAVIWFGLSEKTLYFVVLMGAIPSIANGLMSGLDNIPKVYRRAGFVLGARGRQNAQYVLLPAALPGYLGGLRQGWAFSWRSLMAAELIAKSTDMGFGLGAALDNFRSFADMGGMFMTIIAILLVGVAIELCFFSPLERTVLARRGLGAMDATSVQRGSVFRRRGPA
jgi:NitT/TauT family transport system permease protein